MSRPARPSSRGAQRRGHPEAGCAKRVLNRRVGLGPFRDDGKLLAVSWRYSSPEPNSRKRVVPAERNIKTIVKCDKHNLGGGSGDRSGPSSVDCSESFDLMAF